MAVWDLDSRKVVILRIVQLLFFCYLARVILLPSFNTHSRKLKSKNQEKLCIPNRKGFNNLANILLLRISILLQKCWLYKSAINLNFKGFLKKNLSICFKYFYLNVSMKEDYYLILLDANIHFLFSIIWLMWS